MRYRRNIIEQPTVLLKPGENLGEFLEISELGENNTLQFLLMQQKNLMNSFYYIDIDIGSLTQIQNVHLNVQHLLRIFSVTLPVSGIPFENLTVVLHNYYIVL